MKNNFTDADVKAFLTQQFGHGNHTIYRAEADRLIITTSAGDTKVVPRTAVENYARGNAERAKRNTTADLSALARENVQRERAEQREAKQSKQEQVSQEIQQKRQARDSMDSWKL